ncbi:oligosaccharide MFS transporter [Asticcacaulis endophyticus]|uniref:MFS transporter n=1 Tax=Asticcacaulis endophyticus TaxID=1395890 RepID=A0A918QEI7_9CAUL|nr:oligosaccharide MFS transporter [Asticcacaulis endophyticus]GGZ44871.1 MFS transporter [Asticcacaulis endophyticus]
MAIVSSGNGTPAFDRPGRLKVQIALSAFVFAYFASQAMSISLLSNWLKSTLSLTGEQTGTVLGANFIAALLFQPLYGFISDKIGFKKHVLWFLAVLVACCGPFFYFVYEPLLRQNLLLGAATGGVYLSLTFMAGSFALESYVDRMGRHYGFEYSRVRMFGALGFACAAFFSGNLFNINPHINFSIASALAIVLISVLFLFKNETVSEEATPATRVTLKDSLAVLKLPKFWGFMVLILGVTNLYLVFDQQFPVYYASQFETEEIGRVMFGRLNFAQIFLEAGMLFIAPFIVNYTGIKRGLLLAAGIMIVRITGSGLVEGPIAISAMKMLHSIELPILAVSIFRYIAAHFEARFASTLYMVGVSFGHSLGLAILSSPVGRLYDLFGFQHTYLIIGLGALICWIISIWTLAPDPQHTPTHSTTASPDAPVVSPVLNSVPDVKS